MQEEIREETKKQMENYKEEEREIERIREANALQGWRNRLEERHDDRMSRYGRDVFQ